MGILIGLVAVLVPLTLFVVATAAPREKAIFAAVVGLVGSGLLLLWTFSPGPVGEGEPHLGGMYDAFAKMLVLMYSSPLVCVFAIVLACRLAGLARSRAAAEVPAVAGADLPRATVRSRGTELSRRREREGTAR